MDPHELERHLRYEWSALVDEVARWQPAPWQRSRSAGCAGCPTCPRCRSSPRGGRPPAWTRADPVLGRIVALRAARCAVRRWPSRRCSRSAQALEANDGDVAAAWLGHWQALVAASPVATRAPCEPPARDVASLDATLREAVRGRQLASCSRRCRCGCLAAIFRRHPLSPAAAVAYLGLEALGPARACAVDVLRRAVVAPVACMSLRSGHRPLVRAAHLARGTRRGARLPGARRGSVQLQAYSQAESAPRRCRDLRATLADYETLARRYGHCWPRAATCTADAEHALLEAPQRRRSSTAARLGGGGRSARSPNSRHSRSRAEDTETARRPAGTLAAIRARRGSTSWHAAGPVLAGRAYVLRPDAGAAAGAADQRAAAARAAATSGCTCSPWARPRTSPTLDQALAARKARAIALPDGPAARPARDRAPPRGEARRDRRARAGGTRSARARSDASTASPAALGRARARRMAGDARAGAAGHRALRMDHRLVRRRRTTRACARRSTRATLHCLLR
ncbi:MAG: hypothetical protein MZV65_31440 [Chromatiales bacterium]|nr:hypothetical protein [Chromatiales bacterium]